MFKLEKEREKISDKRVTTFTFALNILSYCKHTHTHTHAQLIEKEKTEK